MNAAEAAARVAELQRRRQSYPLAYASLWDRPSPRTSQRRALSLVAGPNTLLTLILGGNRTGKSEAAAMWAVAAAAGRDAIHNGPEGRVCWVERWLARNGLPPSTVPWTGPGEVWVGSPTFASAVKQIRPKLARWAPHGTRARSWTDKGSEGELFLPGGGVITSKAYRQFDQDPQTWEGSRIRAAVLDEQPNRHANLTAAFSRLIDDRGKAMMPVTPLRGRVDWLYRDVVQAAPAWLRVAELHGADNPHIPQDWRELMLAAVPVWQRASRDVGAFTQPEGAIYPFSRGVHVVEPIEIPVEWIRWVGIDWGVRNPHVVWAAEDPRGRLWAYRELALRRATPAPAVTGRRLIEYAQELEAGEPEGLGLTTVYRGADSAEPWSINEAAEFGWWVNPIEKPAGSVVQGIELVEALLSILDGMTLEPIEPRLFIFRTCPVLIEEMEGYRWADPRPGQAPHPDPACPDHGCDALRYLVMLRHSMGFR